MQVSGEIRWFWETTAPDGFKTWFCNEGQHPYPAGGGLQREDKYLYDPGQTQLGIKFRGNIGLGIEVKGLVSESLGDLAAGPFCGEIEMWTKWTTAALHIGDGKTILTQKTRWLRKFDTGNNPTEIELGGDEKPTRGQSLPERGCNVELTRVVLPESGDVWWSFGFESFGTLLSVEHDLRTTAAVLATRHVPMLSSGVLSSYPRWLSRI